MGVKSFETLGRKKRDIAGFATVVRDLRYISDVIQKGEKKYQVETNKTLSKFCGLGMTDAWPEYAMENDSAGCLDGVTNNKLAVNVTSVSSAPLLMFWMSVVGVIIGLASIVCGCICYIWFSDKEVEPCESIDLDCGKIVSECHEGLKRPRRKCRNGSFAATVDRT